MRVECWDLVTGEYPPRHGGVSDYTVAVAEGLAARGAEVHVWCADLRGHSVARSGVHVHSVGGQWSPGDLRRVDDALAHLPGPRRLLVQWVPHAYGRRALNVSFCRWIRRRGRRGDHIELMVHEPFLAFGEGSLRQTAAAVVHRAMIGLLLSVAGRVWVSVPAWAGMLRPWALRRDVPFCWLPVPSNIPVAHQPEAVARLRAQLAPGAGLVVGHFGTYGELVAGRLGPVLRAVLATLPGARVVLLGHNGDRFARTFAQDAPDLGSRIVATGGLEPEALSCHLQACDLVVQPYPDGVSTRRGTAMAALSHGCPLVTTSGRLTEPFWASSRAATLAPAGDGGALARAVVDLGQDHDRRRRQGLAAQRLYAAHFDLSHTITALRSQTCASTDGLLTTTA